MKRNEENKEAYETLKERSDEYVTAVDEDGKELLLEPVEYFFYNGDEYALLSEVSDSKNEIEDSELNDVESALGCFVCKVTSVKDQNGVEMDEFTPVDDDALAEKLIEIVNTKQNSKEGKI